MVKTVVDLISPKETRRFSDETFRDESIDVDGNAYIRCKFIRCRLIFSGELGVSFKECNFIDCDWGFAGPAANTLRYLSALYHGFGTSGAEMVDGVFGSIQNGIGRSEEMLSFPPHRQ